MTRSINISDKSFGMLRNASESSTARGPTQNGQAMLVKKIQQRMTGQHISAKHLLIVTSQLSVMLAAGCDLCAGLDAMSKNEGHPRVKAVTADLRDSVKGGQAFSQALARHPDVFDPLFVAMVRAGEQAGMLKNMLAALQVMIRNQLRIVSSIRAALMYPAVLVCVAISAIIVMTTFVLPRFAKVFQDTKAPLPLPTVIVLSGSTWLRAHAPVVFLGLIAFIVLAVWSWMHFKRTTDSWILKVPLLGSALKLSYVCRSVQTIGMMAKSGLPLADSLVLTRDMMPNTYYWEFYDNLRTHIGEGKSLSSDFEKTNLFPPMVAQMVAVGEQTGTLATVCLEIASFFEEELQAKIKILTTAMEPLIIVLLGGFVGFIAVSVILPMFKIASALH